MNPNEEMMLPYMKLYNRDTIRFEIQPLNSDDVIYMDDDEDAPIVLKASRPKKLLEHLRFISLINFSSNFRVMVNGIYILVCSRSLTMEEHFVKLYSENPISFTVTNNSVLVYGLYIVPTSFDPQIYFRRVLVDGDLCKEMWIQEIVDQYFEEFQFSFVIHVKTSASWDMSELKNALIECCRKIIQSFIFDLKEIAAKDMIPEDPLSNSVICNEKSEENCDVSLIDVDEIPDESELVNNFFMSCTDDLTETCEFSIGKFQETLLKRMWYTKKWMVNTWEHILMSQTVDNTDLQKILSHIPTQGTALKFWKPPETENLRRSERLKKPTSKETKSVYVDDYKDDDDDDVCFIDVQSPKPPRRPFKFDIPKRRLTRSAVAESFDILKDGDLNNYVKPLQETSPPKSMFLDDGGIILSSDDESGVSKPKKFFTNAELAKKRRSIKTEVTTRKPEFVRTTRKNTARATLDSLDNQKTLKSYGFSKMHEIHDSMLMDIDAPRKQKEEKFQQIKAMVKRHHEGNSMRRSTILEQNNRSSKILKNALNDIKKQAEDDNNKRLFDRYASPEPDPSSRESTASKVEGPKMSYFDPVTFEVNIKQTSLVDMMASPYQQQKKEINFDHIDYE